MGGDDSFLDQVVGGSFIALFVENVRNLNDVVIVHVVLNRGKVGIISNRLDALINCQVRVQLYPLVRIAHIREMETPVSGILHTSKFRLEARLYWIWASHTIFGTEVERLVVPLAVN